MRELAGRLAELDPDAGAALQVIAYFDRLMEGRVGLEALVRGAAVLSGCPARLSDERRGIRIRVEPDGRREDSAGPVDPAWPWAPLDTSGVAGSGTRLGIPAAVPPGSLDTASVSGRLGTLDAGLVPRPPGNPDVSQAAVSQGTSDAGQTPLSQGTPDAASASSSSGVPDSARRRVRLGSLDAVAPSASSGSLDAAPAPVSQGTSDAAPVSPGNPDAGPTSASPGTPDAAPPQASLDTPGAAQPSPPLAPAASPVTDTRPDAAAVPETPAALWLETPGPPDGVRAMILERAAGAVRAVLERTRGWAPAVASGPDPALVEVVLDASAPQAVRTHAAAQLGLRQGQLVCAVALYGGGAEIVTAGRPGNEARRAGVGPAVEPDGLPRSWAAARTALRLTAEGTAHDPGPRTAYADELGALVLLADAVGPDTPPVPDELAVERAVAEAPWAAATLHAVSASPSLRAAAAELTVHHSTLQERLVQAEHILGWDVHSPQGRLRLQLALAVRKLRRTVTAGQAPEGARRSEVQ
ncbi:helix-turn-helix domain-containing protein [Streptomyces sp. NBC_00243]|uniref:helix-turn-helix domain-containing protein n=1 Tax=Streptomyces sp. NBC_00243 TaxID=2975688 RepID=UPI002DDC518F|nr:helix-turn-helix domain-containing protein [Streptomyces sp. NBC_00243]WRZ19124.1 helix-turn-helix domain-containing protein [Streptomyces sp. NBC_00243]